MSETAGDLIREAWERHTQAPVSGKPSWCEQCDEVWPCLTIRLASELNSIPSRVGSAIRATVVSRADAEYQWPTCHKTICHRDHGDIDAVFNLFAMRLKDTVLKELTCRAITEPDEPGMNLNHPDSPDVIQALETRCRDCDVPIIYLEHIAQWWHITGQNVTHAYRGCRDTKGNLIGDHLAEPEEKS